MKFNQKRITSLFKKSIATIPTIDFADADIIFPLEVKTGFVNATEHGYVFNPDPDPTDFGRFERIFSGYEAISTIWQGSTAIVDGGSNQTKAFKSYNPGNAIRAKADTENNSIEFKPLLENSDFLKEAIVSKVAYYYDQKMDEIDLFNLYIIPEKYNNVYFYVTSVENFYKPGTNEFQYCRIEMSSLNDKLAQTGIAVDQYVQRSAPGEGYAWPQMIQRITEDDREEYPSYTSVTGPDFPSPLVLNKIYRVDDYDQNGESLIRWNGRDFTLLKNGVGYVLDPEALENDPIQSMQIELYTPGVLSSMYAMGRPLKSGSSQMEEMQAPRALLPYESQTPSVSQRSVTRPYPANNDYAWLSMSHLEIESFYSDWTQKVEGNWNPSIMKKWLGYLQVNTNDPSNALKGSIQTRILTDVLSFGLAELAWNHADDMVVNNEGVFTLKGPQTLPKMFATGYFKNKSVTRLPLDYKESIPWSLKSIPLVGPYLSEHAMGLPIGFKQEKEIGGKLFNISGTVSNGWYEFYKNTWMGEKRLKGQQKYTGLPLDAFSDEGQPSAISPSEFTTIINMKLSDTFQTNGTITSNPDEAIIPSGELKNTKNLGYGETNANGEIIADSNAKWSGNAYALENKLVDGYAIDGFGFHFLGSGDYRVMFFGSNPDEPVFTGTYKTLSKLTGSTRDWANYIKTSNWKSAFHVDTRKAMPTPAFNLPTNPNINPTREYGLLTPQILLDTSGTPVRDAFGNLVYETDSDGNTVYNQEVQKFSDYGQPNNSILREKIGTLAIQVPIENGPVVKQDYLARVSNVFRLDTIAPQIFSDQAEAIKKIGSKGYDRLTLYGTLDVSINNTEIGRRPIEIEMLPINPDSSGTAQNFIVSNAWVMGNNQFVSWNPYDDGKGNNYLTDTYIASADAENGAYLDGTVFDLAAFKASASGKKSGSANIILRTDVSVGNVGENGSSHVNKIDGHLNINSYRLGVL